MFEAFVLKSEIVEEQEEKLRASVRELNESERKFFFKSFSKQVKDPDTYAVLSFFIITGLHHFYLRKYIRGSINLSLFLFAIAEIFIGLVQVNVPRLGQGLLIMVLVLLIEEITLIILIDYPIKRLVSNSQTQ